MADQMLLMGTAPGEQIYLILDGKNAGGGISVRDDGSVWKVPSWGYMTKIYDFVAIDTDTHRRMWEKVPELLELTPEQRKKVQHLMIDVMAEKMPPPDPSLTEMEDFDVPRKKFVVYDL